jgi:hypothetical protein
MIDAVEYQLQCRSQRVSVRNVRHHEALCRRCVTFSRVKLTTPEALARPLKPALA